MPTRSDLRQFFGHEWRTVIRPRILERAHNRCEQCRKPLHEWIFTYTWQTQDPQPGAVRRYHMIWIREGSKVWRNQHGRPCSPLRAQGLPRKIRVKLTGAHADHDASNMADRNLRCWCTWCHLMHDMSQHKESRSNRKDAARPILAMIQEDIGAQL